MTDNTNGGQNGGKKLSPLEEARARRAAEKAQQAQAPEPARAPASAFGSSNMAAPDRQAGEQDQKGADVLQFPAPASAGRDMAAAWGVQSPATAQGADAPTAQAPAQAAPAASNAEVEGLRAEVETLRREFAKLKTELETLKKVPATSAQSQEVSELTTKVTGLETELGFVRTTANEAKAAAKTAGTNLDQLSDFVAPAVNFVNAYGTLLAEATDDAIVLEGCNAKDFTEVMEKIGPEKARAGLSRKAGNPADPQSGSIDPETRAKAVAALDPSTELGTAFADAAILWAADNPDTVTALDSVIGIIGNGDAGVGGNVVMERLNALAASSDATKAEKATRIMSML